MLTGMVNIAVFAAFRWCAEGWMEPRAEFKACAVGRRLDIARCGWQRRQETARGCCRFWGECCRTRMRTGARTITKDTEDEEVHGGMVEVEVMGGGWGGHGDGLL